MQIITGYSKVYTIRQIQQFRLFHLNRPAVKKWRATRHNKPFVLDYVDQYILSNYFNSCITAVDCAGWYFNHFDIDTVCLESDHIAQLYYPKCFVEHDIFTHRPTYINQHNPVLFKYPWFLKYAKYDDFINFLNIWTTSTMLLNFEPRLIQHNHLKFELKNLVQAQTSFKITEITRNLWTITC